MFEDEDRILPPGAGIVIGLMLGILFWVVIIGMIIVGRSDLYGAASELVEFVKWAPNFFLTMIQK